MLTFQRSQINVGGSVQLDASGTTDAEQDAATLDYAWDFDDDGQYDDATGVMPTYSAAGLDGPDTVTVGLLVTDDEGETDSATATINVVNVAPTIHSVTNDGWILAGESATITVEASDAAGALDPLTYAFDCDDDGDYEVGPQPGNSAVCTFPAAGMHVVNVLVADGDGGEATGSTVVEVLTPQEAIAWLQGEVQALVDAGVLNGGQGNALNSKLANAIKKLDEGQPHVAINNLNAFVKQVNAFINGRVLTAAEGQPLIDAANRIIAAIDAA